jgi:hypothetical protein
MTETEQLKADLAAVDQELSQLQAATLNVKQSVLRLQGFQIGSTPDESLSQQLTYLQGNLKRAETRLKNTGVRRKQLLAQIGDLTAKPNTDLSVLRGDDLALINLSRVNSTDIDAQLKAFKAELEQSLQTQKARVVCQTAQPTHLILAINGQVMAFDSQGEPILEYQGIYQEVVEKLKAVDCSQCRFEVWEQGTGHYPLSQAEFFDLNQLNERIRSLKAEITMFERLLKQ